MWKCPRCETLNTEDRCAICGEMRPREDMRPYQTPYTPPQQERNNKGYAIIAALASVLTILIIIILVIVSRKTDINVAPEETEIPVVQVTEEPTPQPTPQPTPLPTPRITPQPTISPAQKRAAYNNRAAGIELYENTYLKTAMDQATMNIESSVVFKKWDTLLNDVYQYLKQTMTQSEFAALKKEEEVWIKEKEAAIEAAGNEHKGGTMEPLARNSVGIDYTKQRTYYLISLID